MCVSARSDSAQCNSDGLPRRDWFKHQIYAPGFYTGYGVKTMPQIREGLEEGRFTEAQGCTACHKAHGARPDAWLEAAFHPADMTGQCITCHTFGGPERAPHNFLVDSAEAKAPHNGPAQTACIMCHAEHRGIDNKVSTVSDAQCQWRPA